MTRKVSDHLRSRYRQLLGDYRKANSEDPIANRYPWQCAAAIQELASHAVELQHIATDRGQEAVEVKILTGKLPDMIYGNEEVTDHFREFLAKDGLIKVIVCDESTPPAESSLLGLAKAHPEGISVRASASKERPKKLFHFVLIGDRAYRYEAPHNPADGDDFSDFSPEIPARICFNDQDGGQFLQSAFLRLWEQCKAV